MADMELIAVRIKDGVFAGNVAAAEDFEFLAMNKITHVINCAGGEVADFFVASPTLRYLSFPWKDTVGSVCTTVLFDPNDDNINKAVQFIDEAVDAGECVLVHSYLGVSRSPALIAAYFIVKYGWKLESALDFLQMAHPDVRINPHFLRQLRVFAKRHPVEHDIFDEDIDDSDFGLDNDQWMLRNTLLNGLSVGEQEGNPLYNACADHVDVGTRVVKSTKKARISFVDTKQGTNVHSPSTTPVVPGKNAGGSHADPSGLGGLIKNGDDAFVGAQGPSALRSGRTSPSILSRSTSPCSRRLESDPRKNPKGRQELKVLSSSPSTPPPSAQAATAAATKAGASAAQPTATTTATASVASTAASSSAKAPSQAVAAGDAQGVRGQSGPPKVSPGRESSAESNQGRLSYYERLAPPKHKTAAGGGLPARSPLATLSSKHKFRNGSPLPLTTGKAKTEKKGRVRIASSPSSRPSSAAGGSPTSPRGVQAVRSASASSKDRTGSPGAVQRGRVSKASTAVTREANSRYVAIAPQRSGSAGNRPTWGSSTGSGRHERPTVARPLSPAYQLTAPRTGARQRSASVNSRTSSPGDKDPARRRTGSKQKKRTGSPSKPGPATAGGKTPQLSAAASGNTSFSSAPERTGSPGKKQRSSSTQGKLRREPPAAISSRRQ